MQNIDTSMCEKFHYDRLKNDRASGKRNSDNNNSKNKHKNNTNNNKKKNFGNAWGFVSGSKKPLISSLQTSKMTVAHYRLYDVAKTSPRLMITTITRGGKMNSAKHRIYPPQTITRKHTESENLPQTAILNFIESHISCQKYSVCRIAKFGKDRPVSNYGQAIRLEDFRYDGFDPVLWLHLSKVNNEIWSQYLLVR